MAGTWKKECNIFWAIMLWRIFAYLFSLILITILKYYPWFMEEDTGSEQQLSKLLKVPRLVGVESTLEPRSIQL